MFVACSVRLLPLALALVALPPVARADDPPACKAYLVPCNIASPYSGTFHWTTVLQSSAGKTTEDVTVRILKGKAVCEGSIVTTDPSETGGSIKGDGLVVVEWGTGTDDDPKLPWYRVAVACPGMGGSAPARMDSDHMDTYKQPRRQGFAVFEGSTEEENPDADPDNGVTGTMRITWKLERGQVSH
jgi:hypothetical protein